MITTPPCPLHFASLLRAEVTARRSPAGLSADDAFLVWWALYGRREYPAWKAMSEAHRKKLFKPMRGWPTSRGLGMNLVLRHLSATRKDIRRRFKLTTASGIESATAWLFVHGLKEEEALDVVDADTLARINAPEPADTSALTPQPSRLMRWIWASRADVRKTFDIARAPGRMRFLTWCLAIGLHEMGLDGLVSPAWRRWALALLPASLTGATVPRIGLMLWKSRPEVQALYDIRTAAGWEGLANWTAHQLAETPGIAWMRDAGRTPKDTADAAPAPVPQAPVSKRPFGVNLIGFAFGEFGIGEDVRMAAAACDAAGVPHTVLSFQPGPEIRQADKTLEGRATTDTAALHYDINIFCMTGFDTAHTYLKKGMALFGGRYNIGWWPWELPVWPAKWRTAFDLVDEVWAATEFTRAMYTAATDKMVVRMPLPVSVDQLKPASRGSFGLDERRFLFLFVFDSNSYLARKNPEAALTAFEHAFDSEDHSVGLVIKTMNTANAGQRWRRFKRRCAGDRRVHVLQQVMDRGQILSLVQCCDAYISLHRAEGFGRTLAEAMLLAKPVVATNFSGNVDFLWEQNGFPVAWNPIAVAQGEYPFVAPDDGAWWAEPSIPDAAIKMRRAYESRHQMLGEKVRRIAQAQFAPQKIGALLKERIAAIGKVSCSC